MIQASTSATPFPSSSKKESFNMVVSVTTILIVSTVLPVVALLATILRLYIRIRSKKQGVDDWWAISALVLTVFWIVAVWVSLRIGERLSVTGSTAASYLCQLTTYGVVWSVRMSLLEQIIRISAATCQQAFLKRVRWVFLAFFMILCVHLVWTCEVNSAWKAALIRECNVPPSVCIPRMIFDITADVILIGVPLSLVKRFRSTSKRRKTLVLVFLSSFIMTFSTAVQVIVILLQGGPNIALAAAICVTTALLVCNTAVVAGVFMRISAEQTPGSKSSNPSNSARQSFAPAHVLFGKPRPYDHANGISQNAVLVISSNSRSDSENVKTGTFGSDLYELNTVSGWDEEKNEEKNDISVVDSTYDKKSVLSGIQVETDVPYAF